MVGESPYAAVARPIGIKFFEDYGIRYWRAQYELLAGPGAPSPGERIVLEWSCDAAPDGVDFCGALRDRVLPGFESHGRTDSSYVQLELRYQSYSSFDGAKVFYAARDGSMRLVEPLAARDPGPVEGAAG